MSGPVWATASGLAAGGLLWTAYGALTMLKPWGEEVQYSEDRGYSVVVDSTRFVIYNSPGAAALVTTAVVLLALGRSLPSCRPRLITLGRIAVTIAVALGVVSAAGVIALFDPAFTAGRVAGAFFLGLGAVLLALGTHAGSGRPSSAGWLAVAGILGLGLLPLWPLVYAVQVMPEWGAVTYFSAFGLAWLIGAKRVRTTPLASVLQATQPSRTGHAPGPC